MFGGWFWGSTWTARWKQQFCRWTLNMTVQNSVQTQLNVIRLGRNRATLYVTWKLTTEKSVHKNGVVVEVAIAFGTGEVQGEFVSEDWCRWQIEKTSKIDYSLNINIILYYIMKIDLRSKHICSRILCTWERTFVCNLAQLRKAALIFACLWPLLLFEGQWIFKICLKKMYTIAGCFTDFSNSGVAVFLF